MTLRPLILLVLLVVASSGCRTPEMSGLPVVGPIGRSTVEALRHESADSEPRQDRANRPRVFAAFDSTAVDINTTSIQPVNWSMVEDISRGDVCCSPTSQPEFSLREDLGNFGPTLWNDARGLVHVENGLILGLSLAAAIGIRQDLDERVREAVDDHPTRWGDATRVLGYIGEAPYQVPVLMALWGYSVHANDAELHDFSETLISAYTISGLATLAVKGIADTDRPDSDWNGGRWGFPSFHAASAFTIAAVVEEYYGLGAGVPAYTLAGLISWSRIDDRDHDLSDVVFGAAMGWVIGKSVASQHLNGDGHVRIYPWRHPSEAALGMAVETRF